MTQETENQLVPTNTVNAIEVFSVENGLDPFIEQVKAALKGEEFDATTEAGRKKIGSYARKIGASKVALEKMALKLTEDWRDKTSKVNAEKKRMSEKMDAIRDELRKPLDEYNAREAARKEGHESAMETLKGIMEAMHETNDIEKLTDLREQSEALFTGREWEEFIDKATVQNVKNQEALRSKINERIKYEAEQKELEELRAAKAKKEAEEREEALKKQAAEEARIEAEKAAEAEKQRIADEQAKKDAEAKAERERVEAEKVAAQKEAEEAEKRAQEAEKAKKDAEEKAKAEAEAAEKRQKEALEEQKKAQEAEAQRLLEVEAAEKAAREADKEHRKAINNEALDAFIVKGILNEATAKQVLTAIAKGEIPHISIEY